MTSSSPTKAEPDKYQTEGDTLRTTMPKKAWDKGVAKAVKKHCLTKGMNEEEVVRAVGEPTEKSDYGSSGASWKWQLPPGKCVKYDGDNCTEQEKREQIIFFTAKGNVYLETAGCQTLDGQYIYFKNSDLFESAAR